MHANQVYSNASKSAKDMGFIPEVCKQRSVAARLELLVPIFYWPMCCFKMFTVKYVWGSFMKPRWAKKEGPPDHPAIIKLLKDA